MKTIKKVLVIGNNIRNIACSARKAGYGVYALDRFGDIDLRRCAHKAQKLENISLNELTNMIESAWDVDAVVMGSGFEDIEVKNALNNPKKIAQQVSNKLMLPKKLNSLGISHPRTGSIDEAHDLGFPLMIKPIAGSGGIRNIIVRNEAELNNIQHMNDSCDFMAQEFVEGIPCSASLICTGDDAVVVALNEQLIGLSWLTRMPFAYCGNITPFYTRFHEAMIQCAEQIALEFKLQGSNGVDFILTQKGAQVIEINPRFQGSIDTVERSTGVNIFDAHVRSFDGELPNVKEAQCFAAKTIVFSDKQIKITKEVSDILIKCMNKGLAADIPASGTPVQPDEPITTMLRTARTRMMVMESIKKSSLDIKKRTET